METSSKVEKVEKKKKKSKKSKKSKKVEKSRKSRKIRKRFVKKSQKVGKSAFFFLSFFQAFFEKSLKKVGHILKTVEKI